MGVSKENILNRIKVFVCPLITLLLFFCFEDRITKLLLVFTESWLVGCNELIGGIAIVVSALIIALKIILKDNKKRLSLSLVLWLVCLLVVYIHYRCDDVFRFWGIAGVAYLDFFVLPIVTVYIIQIVLLCEKKFNINGNCILYKDEPISDERDDVFGYVGIIKDLLSDLRTMDLSKGSYSIGIEGKWGMGKSSFFNLFKKILKNENNTIIVEFNPRSSAKLDDIQNDFFEKFSETVEPYYYGISRDMIRYQHALQLIEDNFGVKLLRFLPSLTTNNKKDVINNIIETINKRIYVFIDDFDRLTAKEILEVMKVIDRNGDFRQTIFITAYDKDYVNQVLTNYLRYDKKDVYTEKYFSYEICLPVQFRDELSKYVRKSLGEKLQDNPKNAITIEQMQKEWDNLSGMVVPHLNTLRHVKRFMNIFLSRYRKVRNDVVFGDFILVTMLRYFDIKTYHALVEGKLIRGGGLLSNSTNKVLYQADDLDKKLKQYSQWNGSPQILDELFDKDSNKDYELTSKYKRVRWKESFACYFYDYQPEGLYYNDLMQLYDVSNEEEAIKELHILLKYDANKKIFDQGRYVAIENFLRIRPITELRSSGDVVRLFDLLCYINQFIGRSINIEVSIEYMIGKNAEIELNSLCGGDYKGIISEVIRHNIEVRPLSIAFIFLRCNQEMLNTKTNISECLFTQGEIQTFSEWCQKIYFSQIKNITFQNVALVINLSLVKEIINGSLTVSESAKSEFVSFISCHADEFVESILQIKKSHGKLLITIVVPFNPEDFFPYNGMDFTSWMGKNIDDTKIRFVFEKLLSENGKQILLNLNDTDSSINIDDFDRIYELIKLDDEQREEEKVLNVINKNVANSVELLSIQTGLPSNVVRRTINKLKNKGELTENRTNIADAIPNFEQGDFVRIKDSEWEKYKDKQSAVHMRDWNLFEIFSIERDFCRLVELDTELPTNVLEAIPIDGIYDKKIYYDSIVKSTDYSYYMKSFENCFDENGTRYTDLVKEKNFHFVHEIQHWLRKQGDNGLKINSMNF